MTGYVHLYYTDAGEPMLFDHKDEAISVAGSSTKGIAEAIAFAEANHRPLIVDGYSDFLDVSGTIAFGATRGQHHEFRGVLLRSSAPGPAIKFDASVFLRLSWSGRIEYNGSGQEVALFDPQNQAPGSFGTAGGGRICKFGDIHLPFLHVAGGTPGAIVRFKSNNHATVDMRVRIDGLHGGLIAPIGIYVESPLPASPSVNAFSENFIDFGFIGACLSVGLQIGSGQINHQTQPVNGNHWRGAINADSNMVAYLATFAEHEIYDLRSLSINTGIVQYGAIFNQSSNGCIARLPQIQATASVYFGGTNSKVYAPDTGPSGPPIGNNANNNQLIQ